MLRNSLNVQQIPKDARLTVRMLKSRGERQAAANHVFSISRNFSLMEIDCGEIRSIEEVPDEHNQNPVLA